MTNEDRSRGPAGERGARGETGATGERGPAGEATHVDHATIEVAEIDIRQSPASRKAFRGLLRAIVVLFFLSFAIGAANLLFTNSQVHQVQKNTENTRRLAQNQARIIARQQQQIRADCGVDKDLAGLPLANLPNGHPSELGVKIVSDFRVAWNRKGCPGVLPPPDPSFIAGAKFYHLPVN